MYHIYSPAEFARGEKITVWPGRYVPRRNDEEPISYTITAAARFIGLPEHLSA